MHQDDAGTVITETSTYTFTSTNFSGTVTFADDAGMCDYTFTGNMI
jgi:hypothetical protein